MSLWEKVVQIVNEKMNTEAQQILEELRAECPKRTGRTAKSFHIMAGKGSGTVFTSGKGLITNVRIGSTMLSAKYANEGNGGSGRIITSTRQVDRRGRVPGKLKIMNGMYMQYATQVHGYEGTHFVQKVADRHR